jgi:hypothetical protein
MKKYLNRIKRKNNEKMTANQPFPSNVSRWKKVSSDLVWPLFNKTCNCSLGTAAISNNPLRSNIAYSIKPSRLSLIILIIPDV